jgi:hypothetical protein
VCLHTIDSLALCQVAVVLASEQVVAVAAHDTLDVPGGNVVEHSLGHVCGLSDGYMGE